MIREKYSEIELLKIKKIKNMNLSEAFLEELDKLEEAIKNNEMTVVWTYIDNMYPSIKLEYNINNEDKEYIKSFLLSL